MTDALLAGNALPDPYDSTIARIYSAYERQERRPKNNLGPSDLATDCDRAIWYAWRHAFKTMPIQGRVLRLFETGNLAEARFVENLRSAGVVVQEINPATGEQWEVHFLGGHVHGYLDGVIESGLAEAPKKPHVLECKTHNEKSFRDLVAKGVKASKPAHWLQVQAYMDLTGYQRAYYLAVNKNDDTLYGERVEHDAIAGAQIRARFTRIVTAQQPPPKLHDDPKAKLAFVCGSCPAYMVCHGGNFAERNCRTCLHSTPDTNTGKWMCERYERVIDDPHVMFRECVSHRFIPGLVPGEQIDADPAAETVTYQLRDGRQWIDGGALT